MNTFTTWNQRQKMYPGQNRFLNGFTRRAGNSTTPRLMVADCWQDQAAMSKSPEVDVSKTDQEYLLKADLPEMRKEDVSVTVEDSVLCVSGERKREKDDGKRISGRLERWYGNFRRIFTLPRDAISSKITADLRDGVLKVHLPTTGTPETKSVRIKVQ